MPYGQGFKDSIKEKALQLVREGKTDLAIHRELGPRGPSASSIRNWRIAAGLPANTPQSSTTETAPETPAEPTEPGSATPPAVQPQNAQEVPPRATPATSTPSPEEPVKTSTPARSATDEPLNLTVRNTPDLRNARFVPRLRSLTGRLGVPEAIVLRKLLLLGLDMAEKNPSALFNLNTTEE